MAHLKQTTRADATADLRVVLLVDDTARPGLAAEHGFAAWIEAGDRRLLFDTGQGDALAQNAAALGLRLGALDAALLSHGHYDHTGNLALVLQAAPAVRLYCHPDVRRTRYSVAQATARSIGLPDAAYRSLDRLSPARLCWVRGPTWLAPHMGLTGPVPRITNYEDTGGPFFLDTGGRRPDPLQDDQALWVRTERGLVVVVGCSHAGILNTLHHALEQSGAARLHAVLGGFHLLHASPQRMYRTLEDLAVLQPDLIVPCHCTGQDAQQALQRRFGERVQPGGAGASFSF